MAIEHVDWSWKKVKDEQRNTLFVGTVLVLGLMNLLRSTQTHSASTQDLPTRTVGRFGRMIFAIEKKNILKSLHITKVIGN